MSKSSAPNIYLIGFMGTGKSTIGRQLAQQLDYSFLDSDQVIEDKEGRTIPQIFDDEGEAAFRGMEKAFVESGHPEKACVVSCGGGLVFQEGLQDIMESKGIIISLFASPETIYERTQASANRPLLQVDDPMAEIKVLLEKRMPGYLKAGIGVLTDGRTISEIVSHIVRIYQRAISEA